MPTTQELLAHAYDAFNARDVDAVLAMMHPDVVWPNGMEGGHLHGHRAVREYWARQWLTLDPHVDPVGFREEDGLTVVEVRQVVRDRAGTVMAEQTVQHIYLIRDGLIQRMDIRRP